MGTKSWVLKRTAKRGSQNWVDFFKEKSTSHYVFACFVQMGSKFWGSFKHPAAYMYIERDIERDIERQRDIEREREMERWRHGEMVRSKEGISTMNIKAIPCQFAGPAFSVSGLGHRLSLIGSCNSVAELAR